MIRRAGHQRQGAGPARRSSRSAPTASPAHARRRSEHRRGSEDPDRSDGEAPCRSAACLKSSYIAPSPGDHEGAGGRFEVSVGRSTATSRRCPCQSAGLPRRARGDIYILQYVLNKSALTDEEQSQILIALKSLSIPGPARADSLLSRLGTLFDKQSEDWIEVDFSRWGVRPHDQRTLSTLKDAIVLRRVLTFLYFNSYGQRGRRTSAGELVIKPVPLLQAYCHDKRLSHLQALPHGRHRALGRRV